MKTKGLFIIFNLILVVITESVTIIPWWSFLIVSLLMGLLFSKKNLSIPPFVCGFVSGFINWFASSLFFHYSYNGLLMQKIAPVFFLPNILLIIAIGVICGLLNGLACYTGYTVFVKKEGLELN
jgi:hypothetical protein